MASNPPATRAWILDSPTFTYDRSLLIAGGTGEVTAPNPTYLIEHPDGLVMYDTSLDPAAAQDPVGVYGELATWFGLNYPADKVPHSQLSKIGFSPEDVTFVVLSHTHFDHTGGLAQYPNATVIVGEGELAFGFWPSHPGHKAFMRYEDLDPLRGRDIIEVPHEIDYDIFGDGSVVALSTPGHTPGHLSMLVHLPQSSYLLAGDAVHVREASHTGFNCPFDADTVTALKSVHRINRLAKEHNATILINHDPEDHTEFPVAPTALV